MQLDAVRGGAALSGERHRCPHTSTAAPSVAKTLKPCRSSVTPPHDLPVCGGQLRKVFNAVGVVFKGSGFYRTDSRNGAKSDSDGDSGSSDKKAETKSARQKGASGRVGDVRRLWQRQAAGFQRNIIHRAEKRRQLALWTTRRILLRVLSFRA